MTRRAARLATILAVAVSALVPQAAPAADNLAPECSGTVAQGSLIRCTVTFTLPSVPIDFDERHAHFHELATRGTVSLEWIWPDGRFWIMNCMSYGTSFGGVPVLGDYDNWAQCSTYRSGSIPREGFVPPSGTHRLHVTAGADLCVPGPACAFHGRLAFLRL